MKTKSIIQNFVVVGLISSGLLGCATKQKVEKIDDPYTWLEDVNSEKSLAWVKERSHKTEQELQKDPRFEKIRRDALAILGAEDKIPYGWIMKDYVYNTWTDRKNPRGLYRRTTYSEYKKAKPKWEILIDIDKLGRDEGKSWVFRGCESLGPSSDRCLMRLSDGGKDAVETREFNMKTKKFVEGGFFIPLAKSRTTWVDENTILVATDFGPGTMTESGYPAVAKVLKRGQKIEEAQFVADLPLNEMSIYVFDECNNSRCNIYLLKQKDFYNKRYFLFKGTGNLEEIKIPSSANFEGEFKGDAYFAIVSDWKGFKAGSLLKTKWGDWDNPKLVYAPTEKTSFESISFTENNSYLSTTEDVQRKVYRMEPSGELIPFPADGIGSASVNSVDSYSDKVLFSFQGMLVPPSIYEWNGNKTVKIKSLPNKFKTQNLFVEQYFATSADGTQIPYFIVRNKTKAGPQPTLINAYGGFQMSWNPYYDSISGKVWMNEGGQYVVANIRGGGEYGPKWHQSAIKEKRQTAFNDLFAVADDLIKRDFTKADRLSFMGGSNGGLLAGVAYTQRPDLFKAIVSQVPLMDMIRFNQLLAGASWMAEYGNPDVPQERKALLAYSPYHNLKAGIRYPDLFVMTSTFDDRVHPGHARKFIAKMEELKIPYLYYENTEGGHGGAADLNQNARKLALYYTFLFEKLMSSH